MNCAISITFLLTLSLATVQPAAHHRARRNADQFANLIECIGTKNSTDYLGYGCWCGKGNAGIQGTLDAIDLCCKNHDRKYDALNTVGGACENTLLPLSTITYAYMYTCATDKTATCTDPDDTCSRELCEADREAASCFADHEAVYNQDFYMGSDRNLRDMWLDQCFTKTCSLKGDPHWTTFDGRRFDFQGTCKYNLASYSGNEADYFQITAKMRSFRLGVTMTDYVEIAFGVNVVTLEQGKNVTVNGEHVSLDYAGPNSTFAIEHSGDYVVLTTSSELRVAFNGNSYTLINIPIVYETHTQGICGDCDGDAGNDLLKKDGIAGSPCEVGVSWAEPDPGCSFTCE